MTDLERALEEQVKALKRENKRVAEENRQLKDLVTLQIKNRPIVNRDFDLRPFHSAVM